MAKKFDAIIIGAGQAGPPLAAKLTAAGQTVALIEREQVGGTCVNTGCTPTKAMVASAKVAHSVAHAQEYGIGVGGTAKVDFDAVLRRALAMSANSRNSLESWLDGMDGLTLVRGHARFTGPKRISVGGDSYEAEQIFLNVGARAAIPDMPGLDQVDVLTNSDLFWLQERPQHLVIVGGSYIGLEFAQMFRRFGSRVTVVERGPHLAGKEDPEISEAIRDVLEAEGVAVRTNADCIRFSRSDAGPVVGVDCTSGEPEISCSHILLAVGRQPNTDDLSIDQTGVEIDERGFVKTDEFLETNVPGIWALGDIVGKYLLKHSANLEAAYAGNNIFNPDNKVAVDYNAMPHAIFASPQVAGVGLTEREAIEQGFDFAVASYDYSDTAYGSSIEDRDGFVKILAERHSGEILGAHIIGTDASILIQEVVNAMRAGLNVRSITQSIYVHPALPEVVQRAFGELEL